MSHIYLAGPLFSEAERDWLACTKKQLLLKARKHNRPLDVIWPYELMPQQEMDALGQNARRVLFERCREGLDRSDHLLVLLDGTQVDDGTAWEVGYFYGVRSAASKIMGIRTDARKAGESAGAVVNLMIEMACDAIFDSRERLLAAVVDCLSDGGSPEG